jgi:hypothetical protein
MLNLDKVYWDFDGTLFLNVMDPDFARFVSTIEGVDQFKKLCCFNPIVNPRDVRNVITGRSTFNNYNGIKQDLQKYNLTHARLYLDTQDKISSESITDFKARILNREKATYYVDDDIFFNAQLQPKLKNTLCLPTDHFYWIWKGEI